MLNCSVIIVNFNTGKMLSDVVISVLKAENIKEIIVVDNNSDDNSMDLLSGNSKIHKFYRKTNHGFASSCNYGSGKSNSEYLLFLNPDCFFDDTDIGMLIESLKADTKTAIIGCKVSNPDGSEQRANRRRLPTFWRAFKTFSSIEKLAKYCQCFAGVNLNHQKQPSNLQKVEAISGAFILMKTRVFKQINGFDEKYPLHFEDLDLFKRTINCGYDILYNPLVSVVHHQGVSSQSNPKVNHFKKLGMQRYFYKHCSSFSYLMIKLLNKIR